MIEAKECYRVDFRTEYDGKFNLIAYFVEGVMVTKDGKSVVLNRDLSGNMKADHLVESWWFDKESAIADATEKNATRFIGTMNAIEKLKG